MDTNRSSIARNISNVTRSRGTGWYTTPVDETATIITASIVFPLLIFGVVANILTIIVILRSSRLRSSFNIMIVSLCFSDLISALLSVLYVYRRTWGIDNWAQDLPEFVCKLSWGGDTATSIATSLHILTFAFLRFFSLKWPYTFRTLKLRHAMLIIVTIWIVSIGCGFVPFAMWTAVKFVRLAAHLRHDKSRTWKICSLGAQWYSSFQEYTLYGYIVFFYIPLVLVCIFSVGVGVLFCSRRKTKKKNMSVENIVTLNQKTMETQRQRKENQAIFQLALIVGSFMLGYLPQCVYYIYVAVRGTPTRNNLVFGWWFSMITYMTLRLSECLNPIFYNLASSQIREETLNFLRQLCRKKPKEKTDLPKPTQLSIVSKSPSIRKINNV